MEWPRRNELLACVGPWCCYVAIGFYFAYTSPAIAQLLAEGRLTDEQLSSFASSYYVGGMVGSLVSASVADRFGRKTTLMLGGCLAAIGWLLVLVDAHVSMLLIGRLLNGCDAGIGYSVGVAYQVETQRPHFRGILVALDSVAAGIGMLSCFLITNLLTWRWLAVVAIGLDLILISAIVLSPESPRWYLKENLNDEARASLAWLRQTDDHNDVIDAELSSISENFQLQVRDREAHVPLRIVLSEKRYLVPLLLACLLYVSGSLTGFHALLAFQWQIAAAAGIANPTRFAAYLSVTKIVTSCVVTLIADFVSRKALIVISGVAAMTSLLLPCVNSAYYQTADQSTSVLTTIVVLVMSMTCGISLGLHVMALTAAGEVLPTTIRGLGTGLGTHLMYVTKFATVQTFLPLMDSVKLSGTALSFAALTAVCTLLLGVFLPETGGRTLEDIEKMFLL